MGRLMQNNFLFNSMFEIKLRVLLLLYAAKKTPFSMERIVSLDFIVCYAKHFDFPYSNLQGDNQFMYAELAGRRARIFQAIKSLVTQGLIDVTIEKGYVFFISESGNNFIQKLKSDYAKEYKKIAADVIRRFRNESDLNIERMLNASSVIATRGDY